MKKWMLIVCMILTLTLTTSAFATAAETYVTAEAAAQAAFTHANVTPDEATVVRVKLDRDDDRVEYEIEFYVGNMEYDYEVDALTGQVLKFDSELETKSLPIADGLTLMTEEEAKTTACQHAQINPEDVTLVLVQLDNDDGKWEYDVEFYVGDMEYDYEIDAQTGTILSFDQELESKFTVSTSAAFNAASAGGDIGMEQAKTIALENAGFAEGDVTRLKVEKDSDDGKTVYEVEFDVGQKEYSYDIDAADGSILKFKVDD